MIKKIESDNNKYNLEIIDSNNNSFYIIFGGNLDLYWMSETEITNFDISIEDRDTFLTFKHLFNKIKSLDNNHRLITNNTFHWVSENNEPTKANTMQITESNDNIRIEFHRNPLHWAPKNKIAICFCNSGSEYPNIVKEFMKMYLKEAYNIDLENEMGE